MSAPLALARRRIAIARPVGRHRSLALALERQGALALPLPVASLRPEPRAQARAALARTDTAEIVIFTSPSAVRFAFAAAPRWRAAPAALLLAPGPATARALARHGCASELPPARFDSEGLLEHAALARGAGRRVALVTAPGGRDLLPSALAARGFVLDQAFVYRRQLPRWRERHHAVLAAPLDAVLVSSIEAVSALAALARPAGFARLLRARWIVSSERVAKAAREAGARRTVTARSALAEDLIAAACTALTRRRAASRSPRHIR
jgi:uroporphyrinogen-III synthase